MSRIQPSAEEFQSRAAISRIVPVYRELLADHITPVIAFELLGRDDHAFLLESMTPDGWGGGRSFVGSSPAKVFEWTARSACIFEPGFAPREFASDDPFHDLRELLPQSDPAAGISRSPLAGGLVGFAAHDLARSLRPGPIPDLPPDDRRIPELLFGLYREMVIFDHPRNIVIVVTSALVNEGASAEELKSIYDRACRRVDQLVARLHQPSVAPLGEPALRSAATRSPSVSLARPQFESAVRQARQLMRPAGCSQIVLSQRLRVTSTARPFDVYRALRVLHSAPQMFFLKSPYCTLMGASARTLLRAPGAAGESEHQAEVRPGPSISPDTRHRSTPTPPSGDTFDALRAAIPAPLACGEPTLDAMRIIDQLEPVRRGPFGGGVGYVDFGGAGEFCAAIPTIIWRNGSFDVQVGGTVDPNTDPAAAFDATMGKATSLLRAVEIATAGL